MKEKKHFHLMKGSVLNLSPEHSDLYTDGEAAKIRFEEMKKQYITVHDTPEHKLFFSLDEYQNPLYCKVCQFGHIDGMERLPAPPESDVDGVVKGDWQPIFMIMLTECHEDECLHALN